MTREPVLLIVLLLLFTAVGTRPHLRLRQRLLSYLRRHFCYYASKAMCHAIPTYLSRYLGIHDVRVVIFGLGSRSESRIISLLKFIDTGSTWGKLRHESSFYSAGLLAARG